MTMFTSIRRWLEKLIIKVRDYLNNIAWSGVDTFPFDFIIPERIIAQYEADEDGKVFHHPDMDYLDYQQLRDGDRDAVVYVPSA